MSVIRSAAAWQCSSPNLVLVEFAKTMFYAEPIRLLGQPYRTRGRDHRIHRRAARFSHHNEETARTRRAAT